MEQFANELAIGVHLRGVLEQNAEFVLGQIQPTADLDDDGGGGNVGVGVGVRFGRLSTPNGADRKFRLDPLAGVVLEIITE